MKWYVESKENGIETVYSSYKYIIYLNEITYIIV